MELEYFVVDVFTDSALSGNPLAVVMNDAGLSTERMQAIAREFNLSETTFVERRVAAVEKVEGVLVRIFTTQEELPFAGHPTLGTASILRLKAPEAFDGDTVRLALKVGVVPVRFDGDGLFGEMTQKDPEFGAELEPRAVARLTGLDELDLDPGLPPQIVSTGTPFAIVTLRSDKALAGLKVNQDGATAWLRSVGRGGSMCWGRLVRKCLHGGHGCSFTGVRIRLRDRRRDARSAIWFVAEPWLQASGLLCGRAWRWGGRAIFLFPRGLRRRG